MTGSFFFLFYVNMLESSCKKCNEQNHSPSLLKLMAYTIFSALRFGLCSVFSSFLVFLSLCQIKILGYRMLGVSWPAENLPPTSKTDIVINFSLCSEKQDAGPY